MNKEEIKLKLVNKLAKNATYDKELDEWSIDFDKACDIVNEVIDKYLEEDNG